MGCGPDGAGEWGYNGVVEEFPTFFAFSMIWHIRYRILILDRNILHVPIFVDEYYKSSICWFKLQALPHDHVKTRCRFKRADAGDTGYLC